MVTVLIILNIGLVMVVFLVMLNGYLHGAWKTAIDAGLSVLWLVLLGGAFLTLGWKAAFLMLFLSFVYAWLTNPIAAAIARSILGSTQMSERRPLIAGLKVAGGLLLAIFLLGQMFSASYTMPDNAIVFLNDQARTYIAPPCVTEHENLRVATAAEAHKLKYNPDRECRDEGGFIQEGRTGVFLLLEAIGLLEPLPSRWNADGTWNW